MKTLEPPDLFYVQAAKCWLESGNALTAQRELDKIAPELSSHPDVLEVRWGVEARARHWPACLEIAQSLVELAPERPTGWIRRSFVLHRLQRTREALDNLFPAAVKFSDIPVIPYNLACYAAQLQSLWEAERWLKQAIEAGGNQYRLVAQQDTNLQPLWPKITEL